MEELSQTANISIDRSDNLYVIKHLDKEFFLLGTAHISQKSVEEVLLNLNSIDYQCIALELDEKRANNLLNPLDKNIDLKNVVRQGQGLFVLINLIISAQQKRMGGAYPLGEEFRTALLYAQEKNISYSLIDRDARITLKRVWVNASLFNKMKLLMLIFVNFF